LVAELFRADKQVDRRTDRRTDGRADRRDEASFRFSQFCK